MTRRPPYRAVVPAALLALLLVRGAWAQGAAQAFRLRATNAAVPVAALMNAEHPEWRKSAASTIVLQETPRLYASDPRPSGRPIRASVRALRSGTSLLLHLRWPDATRDVPAPGKAGSFPRPSTDRTPTRRTDAFADGASVMVPKEPAGDQFPSLQMGDARHPVHLYTWDAVRQGRVMEASGRATTRATGAAFPVQARHDGAGWTVVLQIPAVPDGTPLAFAVWDGAQGHRDGRKYFSVWYVLEGR